MKDERVSPASRAVDRRAFLAFLAAVGAGPALGQTPAAPAAELDLEDLATAARLIDLDFSEAESRQARRGAAQNREHYEKLHGLSFENGLGPALLFDPLAGRPWPEQEASWPATRTPGPRAPGPKIGRRYQGLDLLSMPIAFLGQLLRGGGITSVELTRAYLERIAQVDPTLCAMVTVTEERALDEAERADAELSAGVDRGPLHGLPWVAKDLLAARGYLTTWGATPFRGQRFPDDATVVRKLAEAGAVLIAKTSVGALAWGDVWFGGRTGNPWLLEQGSSGSSAGSAAAVVSSLASFGIGTETLGSIVSPATRCGATGLRPTFGRVSRHGAMALCWSMDKIGPLGRSAEDCALVFEAIAGPDPGDPSAKGPAFRWQRDLDPAALRIGYPAALFDEDRPDKEWRDHDRATLETFRRLGFRMVEIELPTAGKDALPIEACGFVVGVEAATAFDELTRTNRDDLLERQSENAWPNVFRHSRLVPAVEYLQANRLRSLAMQRMEKLFEGVDLYLSPTYGGRNLLLTNLTGHPQICVPNGFRRDGTPTSITLTGRLFGENPLLAVAIAYQKATDFHGRRPPI